MAQFSFSDEHGLWMRISYYAHPDSNMPKLTLLPMIHLGEKDYYRAINDEMWCHDTAFLEGSYMPARRALHLGHRIEERVPLIWSHSTDRAYRCTKLQLQ